MRGMAWLGIYLFHFDNNPFSPSFQFNSWDVLLYLRRAAFRTSRGHRRHPLSHPVYRKEPLSFAQGCGRFSTLLVLATTARVLKLNTTFSEGSRPDRYFRKHLKVVRIFCKTFPFRKDRALKNDRTPVRTKRLFCSTNCPPLFVA